MIRLTAHISGHVQGVGFRFTTQRIARAFAVTGFVQNLADGRVLIVAEGHAPETDAFLATVREQMAGHVHRVKACHSAATGKFSGDEAFVIRR